MTRYRSRLRCTVCPHKWSVITYYAPALDDPTPPCPKCGAHQAPPIGMDLTLNKAPSIIGGNLKVKALDETANIVMQDYGMTDLRDDVRPGENAVPKLPPRQQVMADGFFGGGGAARQRRFGFNPAAHVRAAMSGALRDPVSEHRSIGATHAARVRPPTHLVADDWQTRR